MRFSLDNCRREGLGGNYLCGQSPTAAQEPSDTDLDTVDMDWFEEQVEREKIFYKIQYCNNPVVILIYLLSLGLGLVTKQ